jgi:hypothetical protein
MGRESFRRLGMKKAIVFLAAGLLLFACLPAFSQENAYPKDAYAKTVPIAKIWVHPLGYMVVYFKGALELGEMFVPLTWFNNGPAGKAELVWGNEPGYPYFSLFWVDGKFDHVSLHVVDSLNSLTWGTLEASLDLKDKFDVQGTPQEF